MTIDQIGNKVDGVMHDLLTKGGRRTHAFCAILAVSTLCTALIMVCVGALIDARKDGSKMVAAWAVPIGALSVPLGTVATSLYRRGKEAEANQPPATTPNP